MKFNVDILPRIKTNEDAIKAIENTAKGVFILAGLQLFMIYLHSWLHIIDASILALCGYILWYWRSRWAALVLLALSLFLLITTLFGVFRSGPNNIVISFAILFISIRAVIATFKLHEDSASETDTIKNDLSETEPVPGTASVSQATLTEQTEEVALAKEWYVLVGVKGKALSQKHVKELYDSQKVKIRGPYLLDEIFHYHDNGLITNETILFKKGNNEWQPFERFVLKPTIEAADKTSDHEPEMEWFILVGIKAKVLASDYVKDLYNSQKIQIKGPHSTDILVKYFNNGTIDSDTIVSKKGDQDWQPLSKQKIKQIDNERSSSIFEGSPSGSVKARDNRFWSELYYYLFKHKKMLVSMVAVFCLLYAGYDYYSQRPEQIYKRIKKNVVLITSESSNGVTNSLGTGFIIENSNLIATNFHVIDSATLIRVKSGNYVTLDIDGVVYVDPVNDIALLKIKNKPADITSGIPVGKVNKINVGERVYTIGNPAGLEFSLSEGIISGKRATDPMNSKKRELIQITAPISPGNSGGPLLDKKGNVIGITTMASKNDYQNLNFAIPITLIGKTEQHKEVIYKFLPDNPKWSHLVTRERKKSLYDSSQNDGTGQITSAYYSPESVTSFGDQRKRFWAYMNIKKSYYSAFRVLSNTEMNSLILVEIDCKNSQLKFNLSVTKSEGKSMSGEADFSDENDWIKLKENDMQMYDPICK